MQAFQYRTYSKKGHHWVVIKVDPPSIFSVPDSFAPQTKEVRHEK